jgi:hypothetical protein
MPWLMPVYHMVSRDDGSFSEDYHRAKGLLSQHSIEPELGRIDYLLINSLINLHVEMIVT